jgi:peptidoglycan/xylan/chitin deacetylase (PgdA/CDA1 family)
MYPSYVWEKPSQKNIYLTFDDGPHPTCTDWIMDELDKFQAKATFFCIGENLIRFKDIAQELVNRGHLLANHTYKHEKGSNTDRDKFIASINDCNLILNQLQGFENTLFRPPYGRLRRSQKKMIIGYYQIIMWTHLAWDFRLNLNIDRSIKKLLQVKPGSIVVFHDNEKSFKNLQQILPTVLSHWSSLNYTFSTL